MTAVKSTGSIRLGVSAPGTIIFTDDENRDHVFTPHAILAVIPRTTKILSVHIIGGQQVEISVRDVKQAITEYIAVAGGPA